jgi:DNA repair photolyase
MEHLLQQDEIPLKGISWIDNKSILTPTSGFLASGYTDTLNPYSGCAFAGALCGTFCYAQHQHWITRGRPWGLYGAKRDIRQAYQRDYDRIKRRKIGAPRPLRIYMASSTDPYIPQEQRLGLTRAVLEEMQERPPDVLVIQTHTTLINRDLDLIQPLSKRCELWVSITCETDMDPVPGFPPHASRPAKRLETLKRFRDAGVATQATVSPLMPLADPHTFAHALDTACERVVLDHYLLGDGSHGARTRRTNFLVLLAQAGFSEWVGLEKFWEVRDLLASVLGAARVLVSAEGFNAVGNNRKPFQPEERPKEMLLKRIAVRILGSDRESVDLIIAPGATASDILTQLGLAGSLLVRRGEQHYLQPEEAIYDTVEDGDMLYASVPVCELY